MLCPPTEALRKSRFADQERDRRIEQKRIYVNQGLEQKRQHLWPRLRPFRSRRVSMQMHLPHLGPQSRPRHLDVDDASFRIRYYQRSSHSTLAQEARPRGSRPEGRIFEHLSRCYSSCSFPARCPVQESCI